MSSTTTTMKSALVKRREADMSLMPPPPVKRLKRPAVVLDEDVYTEALSDIIARDFFPGLAEAAAQEDYLNALDSNDQTWITEAGQKLIQAMSPTGTSRTSRQTRDSQFDSARSWHNRTPLPATPRTGDHGATPVCDTPQTAAVMDPPSSIQSDVDTSTISLSAFQTKYTSEDNESFNAVIDKHNTKLRQKHSYLWTETQRIPSKSVVRYRDEKLASSKEQEEQKAIAAKDGRELVPLTTGAVSSRPARPDSWKQNKPGSAFMFNPSSVDETGLQTVQEVKESMSRAGPKQIIYANTRLSTTALIEEPGTIPPSPSLDTQIIAQRDARRAQRASSESTFTGSETPRVNGYAFVDEDEPEDTRQSVNTIEPSFRDLLAGQAGDATSNPFMIHEKSKREDLHHRLVEKDRAKQRLKDKQTTRTPLAAGIFGPTSSKGGTPSAARSGNLMMTPAARSLMEKLGHTPVANANHGGHSDRTSSRTMWTPGNTPRRKA